MARMDARKDRILHAIIEDYTLTAVPVGSRTLEKKYFPDLSSATIRNEMSDLAELGLLLQPHVSAGRVPSHLALRRYADELLSQAAAFLSAKDETVQELSTRFSQTEDLLPAAAEMLSRMTRMTAVVMMPGRQEQKIRRLQLIPTERGKALLIMITDGGEIRQTVLPVSERLDSDALYAISRALTEKFSGRTMKEVQMLLSAYRREGADEKVLEGIAALAGRIQRQSSGETVAVGGRHNILFYPEYSDIEKARRFMSVLEEDEGLRQLMRAGDRGCSVLIGAELGIEGLEDCALVSAGYAVSGGYRGTVNVLGPARMPYRSVLESVHSVARMLEALMGGNE